MSDTTGSPATMPKQGESLWNYYALGGPKCTICGKHVRRPVNRNAHAEMHVRRGEAHEAFSGIAYHTEFLVGAKP